MDSSRGRPYGTAEGRAAPYDAVILAGGRAERLGGMDKPGALVGGVPLVERVATAVADARTLIVVGPPRTPHAAPGAVGGPLARAVFTREEPPGAGPVPALRAGMAEVTADWMALLAADLPFLTAGHVSALFRAVAPNAAGAVLMDDGGREQWLTGVWRTAVLRDALHGYAGRSLHRLLGPLEPVRLRLPASRDGRAPWFDCDTMEDLGAAREREGARSAMNVLEEWTALVCRELGIDPAQVDRSAVLDLTRDVAHGVARPAAPLTAYLLGLAQGAGTAQPDAVDRLSRMAQDWAKATTETLGDS
jgi:molybdopterin-guanine dinucleotide biosynthesis protein A